MNLTVYLPFLASIAIGFAGPIVARRARPAAGATVLAAVVLIAAAGSLWAMALLAVTFIDDIPALRRYVGPMPVPDGVALLALSTLLVASARLLAVLLRRRRVHHRVQDVLADLEPADSDVLVLADARPDAFAVPGRYAKAKRGRRPRIVVTEGMLAVLDTEQRRALLAHERAHLDAGHHRIRAAVDFAAAANPLLIPARATVGYLCERWADERAVAEVGSRRLVADAIAAAALAQVADARTNTPGAGIALGFNKFGTVDRVAALNRPAPSTLRASMFGALAVAILILIADVNATSEMIDLLRRLV
jgi:Zn-dependent protease with chaperone function